MCDIRMLGLSGLLLISGWPSAWAATARAAIQHTTDDAELAGEAILTDTARGLQVLIHITEAPRGLHGMHLHEHGACGNRGNDAGGHWNPERAPHGFLPTDGLMKAHAGDFGNLEIRPDGTGSLELTLPGLTVNDGPYAVAGKALIIHEHADDFGQPTGNAGGRIGCGVMTVVSE